MSGTLEIGINEGERRRNRLNALGVVNDLHPVLDELRERGDVHPQGLGALFGQPDMLGAMADDAPHFSVLGFESADSVFRQPEIFSSHVYANTTRMFGPNMLAMDAPDHRRYRALVQPAFAKRTMESWESRWLVPILDQLIASIEKEDRVDLYTTYCGRFPAHTIARSFGIESADVEEMHDLVLRLSDRESPQEAAAAAKKINETILNIIEARRASPQDDVISVLATSELTEEDGSHHALADEEILGFATLMLTAGSGTTYRSLGVLLLALLQRPSIWDQVVADRSLVPALVEEAIRWDPPLTSFPRLAVQDTELAGVSIPKGAIIDVVVLAANHDPRRWDDPHAFDPSRPMLPHLGFGNGPHFCVGNQLARMELGTALERLLDRFPGMRLDPSAPEPFVTGILFRMPTAVPVLLRS